MRWIRFTLLLLITVAAVQAQVPNTVITGPYGVPRLVRDEGEQWVEPMWVYSDAKEIVYIPDITKPSWAQWHVQEFKNQGTYSHTYIRICGNSVPRCVRPSTSTRARSRCWPSRSLKTLYIITCASVHRKSREWWPLSQSWCRTDRQLPRP